MLFGDCNREILCYLVIVYTINKREATFNVMV